MADVIWKTFSSLVDGAERSRAGAGIVEPRCRWFDRARRHTEPDPCVFLTMKHYGTPDLSVTADTLMYGVFRRDDGKQTHCAYNVASEVRTVTFSDGVTLQASPNDLTCN